MLLIKVSSQTLNISGQNCLNQALKKIKNDYFTIINEGSYLEIENILKNYDEAMTKIEIRRATSCLRKIWSIGNEYLQRSQPWVLIKTNEAEAAKIIRFGLRYLCSLILPPI